MWPVDEGLAALAASKSRKELEDLAALQFYDTAAANSTTTGGEEAQEAAASDEEVGGPQGGRGGRGQRVAGALWCWDMQPVDRGHGGGYMISSMMMFVLTATCTHT
jgi:hypothetical protein